MIYKEAITTTKWSCACGERNSVEIHYGIEDGELVWVDKATCKFCCFPHPATGEALQDLRHLRILERLT